MDRQTEIERVKSDLKFQDHLPPLEEPRRIVCFKFRMNHGVWAYILRDFMAKLPFDAKIVRLREDDYSMAINIFVESSEFPVLGDFMEPPLGDVRIMREYGSGDSYRDVVESVSWRRSDGQ